MVVPLGDVFSERGARRRLGRLRPAAHRARLRRGRRRPAAVGRCSSGCRRQRVFMLVGVRRRRRADRSAASMSTLRRPRRAVVAVLGVCAGSVYVLGFTILHETVDDELRGRIFSALYTLVRLCLLLSFAVGPLLAEPLGRAVDQLVRRRRRRSAASTSRCPGVRLTLWLAGVDHPRRRRARVARRCAPASGAERRRRRDARRFIAFEGGEACGKSTQAARLAARARRGAHPRAGRHAGRRADPRAAARPGDVGRRRGPRRC